MFPRPIPIFSDPLIVLAPEPFGRLKPSEEGERKNAEKRAAAIAWLGKRWLLHEPVRRQSEVEREQEQKIQPMRKRTK